MIVKNVSEAAAAAVAIQVGNRWESEDSRPLGIDTYPSRENYPKPALFSIAFAFMIYMLSYFY